MGLIGDTFRRVCGVMGYYPVNVRHEIGTGFMLPIHLALVFSRLRINCVFDVGANVGQYGRMLRKSGYRGHIFSFEPVKETFTILQDTVRGDERWKAFNIALGASAGVQVMNLASYSELSSFLPPNALWDRLVPNVTIVGKEEVEVCTLDVVFEELVSQVENPRPFLKLDTQGFDLEVVKGARNCISKILGLQSELAVRRIYEGTPDYLAALAFYSGLGFTPKDFYTVASDGNDLSAVEVDCIMLRNFG